jgi:hypothetical protein
MARDIHVDVDPVLHLRRGLVSRLAVQDGDVATGLQLVGRRQRPARWRQVTIDQRLSVADLRDGDVARLDGIIGLDDAA